MNTMMRFGVILAAVSAAAWLCGYLMTEHPTITENGANIGAGAMRILGPYCCAAGVLIAGAGYLSSRRSK